MAYCCYAYKAGRVTAGSQFTAEFFPSLGFFFSFLIISVVVNFVVRIFWGDTGVNHMV